MTPYYSESGIQIYCGDCREILPTLQEICDLLLTDPPYGVDGRQGSKGESRKFMPNKNSYGTFDDSVEYVKDVCLPAFATGMGICKRGIITPGNRCLTYYPPPNSFGCFWQPASIGLQPWGRADSQPIFYYGKFPRDTKGIPGQSLSFQVTQSTPENGHPCPKPLGVWTKLLLIGSNEGELILDPFMGSGTTLVAAKLEGRRAIGIEIEERYCEIAADRLRQGVLFSPEVA